MTKTSTERSIALRERRAKSGQKELRGIWLTASEESAIKPMIKKKLDKIRGEKR